MFSMKEFMDFVKEKETFFKAFNRFKESSLQTIIDRLGGEYEERKGMDYRNLSRSERQSVDAAVQALPAAKLQKYQAAINYLRRELPVPALPHVNTARADERFENCALCSVAALLGKTTTEVASGKAEVDTFFVDLSRKLRLPRGEVRDVEQYGLLAEQLNAIQMFLTAAGYATERFGSVNEPLRDDRLRARMASDAEGTEYIVFLRAANGFDAHFNYAKIVNGRPRFFDYQQNYAGGPGTQSDDRPIWPEDRASDADERFCVAIRAIFTRRSSQLA